MKPNPAANQAISEHQHLVKVLRSTSHDDDRREAKKQAAELKTLRRQKVRDGLPAKPAPEAYPGVEPGDSLYIHHSERGPIAVKVHAQGRHGITATDSEGNWHRAKWQHVLGAKQRLSQRLTLVDQGEDGAITEDEAGERRYVAIDPEAREDQEPLRKSQPTDAQIEAGNYRKEHLRFQGLDISIENPKGSVRAGTDPDGKPWRVTMHHAYGYIRGTCGVDKDHVDCYLGPNPDASHAYVVHQRQAGNWKVYDEDKVMLGFDSAADAKTAYLAQYDDPRFFGDMTALPMADFKRKALATRNRPRLIKGQVLFFKTHIPGYTKQDGTFVAPHEDKRAPAKEQDTKSKESTTPTVSALPSSENLTSFQEAHAYYQQYLSGKTIDLSVQLKSGTYPLKVNFSPENAHAYTHKAKSNETPDTWDNPRHRRGPRAFDLERAKMLDRLIPTVQRPWKLLGDRGSDLYFSQQQENGCHYLVVLTIKSVGHAELATAYPVTADVVNQKRHELRPVLPAGQKKKPLHKAEAFSLINPQFIGVGGICSHQDIAAPRCSPYRYEAGAKNLKWFQSRGLQLPKEGTTQGDSARILTEADVVKPPPLQKALILFLKADVKGHTWRLASGKVITIAPYRDKRGHQADERNGKPYSAKLTVSLETLSALRKKHGNLEPWARNLRL